VEKRILLAVDESIYSRNATEYAVGIGPEVKDLRFTLFNVQPKISEFLLEDARIDDKARKALREVRDKNEENSNKVLKDTKDIMIKLGVDEKAIEMVSQPQSMGTAKTILDYGKQSLCDAIVLGKRGMSSLAESFIGSVTNNVLEYTSVTPVWAVGGDVKSSKIMVAIDGSESALSAVDHVASMVGDNPEAEVTLLHVTPRLKDYCTIEFDEEGDIVEDVIAQGDKQCVDSFYIHARQKFEDAGLKENQIIIKEVKSILNIGKTIVDEGEIGNFGTIVIGRRGVNNSFFMGSVSRYVLTNASDCAVWLVP